MPERPRCRCPLCRTETELRNDFLDREIQDRCRQVLSSAPELAVFSSPGALLEQLRFSRDTLTSDAILRALLSAKETCAYGTVERLLILAFLPSLHRSVRCVTTRYPQLSSDDASQQALQSLLRFVESGQLRSRQSYFGFAISRHVKRATFEWAQRELRARSFEPEGDVAGFDSSADGVERLALLRHFLTSAVRRGALTEDEVNLLVEFKLENGCENGNAEGSSNALRQRLKRLLAKLRRLAAGQGRRR